MTYVKRLSLASDSFAPVTLDFPPVFSDVHGCAADPVAGGEFPRVSGNGWTARAGLHHSLRVHGPPLRSAGRSTRAARVAAVVRGGVRAPGAAMACAPSIYWLIGLRAVSGLSNAGIAVMGLTLVGDLFPQRERGRALGWVFGAIAGGAHSDQHWADYWRRSSAGAACSS